MTKNESLKELRSFTAVFHIATQLPWRVFGYVRKQCPGLTIIFVHELAYDGDFLPRADNLVLAHSGTDIAEVHIANPEDILRGFVNRDFLDVQSVPHACRY